MTEETTREIRGDSRTVRQLLSGQKYSIDYYQREYKWTSKQVAELIDDLTGRFLDNYDEGHERTAVEHYSHYFLGSIVISIKNGKKYIIDGQQRLTTLTLLLIYLNNLQNPREDRVNIRNLIFSEKYGRKSFNLDVSERARCMEALFNQEMCDLADAPESVKNIARRYEDIEALFPRELKGEALPYFIDWLTENVHLVEIRAYSDEDAYLIFETMNDRGLSLTPTDMLKGYLLANIRDEMKRTEAAETWRQILVRLRWEDEQDLSADFFKAWLRSQYARSIRERRKGAAAQDFDRIGTEFHRWVREKRDLLGLAGSDDFYRFITADMDFYARQFDRIIHASRDLIPPLERLFFIAQHGFTLQYPVLLAPLRPQDSEVEILQKLRIVATYIDILLARRLWNWRSISYSTLQYAMFLVMRDIRGQSPEAVAAHLSQRLEEEELRFASNERFALHGQNRIHVHRLLARLTEFVERESGWKSRYREYIGGRGRQRYEVEHIWADHYEWHRDEFSHPRDFADYRNRIGGLLLLPRSINASFGDLPYEEKLEHYLKQNLLAQSLHPRCYDRNPGFLRFIERTGLPFKPHPHFKKKDLDERQRLYLLLAEELWHPRRLWEPLETG